MEKEKGGCERLLAKGTRKYNRGTQRQILTCDRGDVEFYNHYDSNCIYNKIQKPDSYPGKEKASTCKGTISCKLTPGAFIRVIPTYFLPNRLLESMTMKKG